MSWSGKTIVGFALLAFGVCAFLGIFGIHLTGLITFFLGIAVVIYGLKKLKEGRKGLGIIALIFALILLGHSLPFIIGLGFAFICIYFGWQMIKKGDTSCHRKPAAAFGGDADIDYESKGDVKYKEVELDDRFETEWKDFMRKQDKREDT